MDLWGTPVEFRLTLTEALVVLGAVNMIGREFRQFEEIEAAHAKMRRAISESLMALAHSTREDETTAADSKNDGRL